MQDRTGGGWNNQEARYGRRCLRHPLAIAGCRSVPALFAEWSHAICGRTRIRRKKAIYALGTGRSRENGKLEK